MRGGIFLAVCLLAVALAGPVIADDFQTCELSSGERAIAACNRAIASGKYTGTALAQLHNNRGVDLERKGETAAAIADYGRAIALFPAYANALNNRGKLKRSTGDLDGALADFNEAIRIEPTSHVAINKRGNVRRDKLDLAGAVADYNAAIRLDPNRALYYANRGLAFEESGDRARARADYAKALLVNAPSDDETEWAKNTARERLSRMGN